MKKMRILKDCGIVRLSGAVETISVNGETINICGVDDPDAARIASMDKTRDTPSFLEQVARVKKRSENGHYSILLSHRPEYLKTYADYGFDLVLSGHAHGGQWRIPGWINGVYSPDQGLFPQYAGGRYTRKNTTMIVSRGLAKESTRIPRFYNRPEVVLLTLHEPRKKG